MNDVEILHQTTWNLLGIFNISHPLLYINVQTIISTWIVLIIIAGLGYVIRMLLHKKESPLRFFFLQGIAAGIDLTTQTIGTFNYHHFCFIATLFIFILFCNWLSLIPWTIEPTKDLNTALGLGLIAFLYKEFYTIKIHGWKGYFAEFTQPFFVMFPVNIIGHFSKIISLSFRLFGNIFGGAIISELYLTLLNYSFIAEVIGLISGLNFIIMLAFGVFEGLIQAFVFSMLSLTYLALSIQPADEEQT